MENWYSEAIKETLNYNLGNIYKQAEIVFRLKCGKIKQKDAVIVFLNKTYEGKQNENN